MRTLILFLFIFLISHVESQKKPIIAKKSKLCGDEACSEVLFKAKIIRSFPSNHPSFLNLPPEVMGKQLEVLAIKYSDRTDIAEGRMEDGSRGDFYMSAVEKGPYVEYLRNAIETKKIMYQISRDAADVGDSRILGDIHAEMDLVRDYNVRAKEFALEQGLPEPEGLPVPESPAKGHGHSHDHGHSHGHSHSHVNSHGHSHEQPATTPSPPVAVPPSAAAPTQTPSVAAQEKPVTNPTVPHMIHPSMATPLGANTPLPKPVQEAAPPQVATQAILPPAELPIPETLTNKLDNPEVAVNSSDTPLITLEAADMEAEIERMMKEDEDNLRKIQEQAPSTGENVKPISNELPPAETATQPPLVLESLKVAPEVSPPEAVSTMAPHVAEPLVDLPPVTSPPPESTTSLPVVEELPTTTPAPEIQITPPRPVENVNKPNEDSHDGDGHGHSHEHAHKHDDYSHEHHGHSHSHEESSHPPPPVETIPEDPKNDLGDEKGYCYKNSDPECEKIKRDIPPAVEKEPSSSHEKRKYLAEEQFDYKDSKPPTGSGFFASVVASITGVIRSVLPVGDMSDAGIGLVLNLIFFFVALLLHIINKLLSDGGDHIGASAREFHNLVNQNKALKADLDTTMAELKSVSVTASQVNMQEVHSLRGELATVQLQCKQYKEFADRAEAELEKEKRARQQLDKERDAGRDAMRAAETRVMEFERQLETVKGENAELARKAKETKNALERFEKELHDEKTANDQLKLQLEKAKLSLKKGEDDLSKAETKIKDLEVQNRKLDEEVALMLEQFQKEKKESDNGESGGSGGWSDFGDDAEVEDKEEKQKTPPIASTNDLRDVFKLKAQVKQLEQDLVQAKNELEKEGGAKERLQHEMASLRVELERKLKEGESMEQYRRELDQRLNDLISMVKVKDTRIDELSRAREELKGELEVIKEEKMLKEMKIKELDLEMKKWKNDFLKLEATSFTKETEYVKKLAAFQNLKALAPPTPYDMPHNTSSERDNAPSRLEHVTTWDDPDPVPRSRTFSPDDDYGLPPPIKKSSRSRRSDRLVREPSPSDGEKRKEKKEGASNRRRSRSHGRQVFTGPMGPMPPYMPGGPGYPPMHVYPSMPMDPMYFGGELNKRHSRSGHVYYSSGGSNGGRSPPPEMPLIAAPPPGTRRPKPRDLNDYKSN